MKRYQHYIEGKGYVLTTPFGTTTVVATLNNLSKTKDCSETEDYGPFLQNVDISGYMQYSKTCVKRPLAKRPKIGFQDQLSLNAGQKYCRMP